MRALGRGLRREQRSEARRTRDIRLLDLRSQLVGWGAALARRLDLVNAVRVGSQAVTIYERLAERWPDTFRSELTAAQETVGRLLDQLGTESA